MLQPWSRLIFQSAQIIHVQQHIESCRHNPCIMLIPIGAVACRWVFHRLCLNVLYSYQQRSFYKYSINFVPSIDPFRVLSPFKMTNYGSGRKLHQWWTNQYLSLNGRNRTSPNLFPWPHRTGQAPASCACLVSTLLLYIAGYIFFGIWW